MEDLYEKADFESIRVNVGSGLDQIPVTVGTKTIAYTERDLIELACRAPACPEWFEPDMNRLGKAWIPAVEGIDHKETHPMLKRSPEFYRQQLIQWPKAYARMVLEAK